MRYKDFSEAKLSPELVKWVTRWVNSSEEIEDQIQLFDAIRTEAHRFLSPSYPAIYRGLAIDDDDLAKIESGISIRVPAHKLQSWTLRRDIAEDYAIPGIGGDYGILVEKTGEGVVADIFNMAGYREYFSGDVATYVARESEVIVETDGWLVINPKEVIAII